MFHNTLTHYFHPFDKDLRFKLKNKTILNFFPEIWYSIAFVLWLIRSWNAVSFSSVMLW